MNKKTLTLLLLASITLLSVAGVKVSKLTRTTSFASNDLFIGNDSPLQFRLFDPAGGPSILFSTELASNPPLLQILVAAFPNDPSLRRALGMLHFQRGEENLAREHIAEALRLSPNDRQAAFLLERLGAAKQRENTGTQP